MGTIRTKRIRIVCGTCSKEIWCRPVENRKYCSKKCSDKSKATNKAFIEKQRNQKKFKGHLSPHWKGGVRKSVQGYIFIYSPNHPRKNQLTTVKRCHLVMEKMIGRYLEPGEIVHHKGTKYHIDSIENKQDDRPENLQLFANVKEHFTIGHGRKKGGYSPFRGKKHTKEANEKNRQAHLGKEVSVETRKKLSIALKKYHLTSFKRGDL